MIRSKDLQGGKAGDEFKGGCWDEFRFLDFSE